jgi:FcoT-like thioesterase domain
MSKANNIDSVIENLSAETDNILDLDPSHPTIDLKKTIMNQHEKQLELIDNNLINKVLKGYLNKDTIYLKEARVDCGLSKLENNNVDYSVHAALSIGHPCYYKDEIEEANNSRHFNAVEFAICANQIIYAGLYHAVDKNLLHFLSDLSKDENHLEKLLDIYIVRMESSYKSVLNPANFSATWKIQKAKKMQKLILIKTTIRFFDCNGGLAFGEIDLALT